MKYTFLKDYDNLDTSTLTSLICNSDLKNRYIFGISKSNEIKNLVFVPYTDTGGGTHIDSHIDIVDFSVGHSTTAETLTTSRTLWGQSFNGSTNITGNLSSVGSITPSSNNSSSIGSSTLKFNTVYATTFNGNATSVTNGVYTTGDQTIAGTKTFSSTIKGSISGNAATATKATNDSDGKAINTTYLKKSGGTLTGTLTTKSIQPVTDKLYDIGSDNLSFRSVYSTYFRATSDRRLKENIIDADTNFSDIVKNIRIREYNFKSDETKLLNIGLIAQELRDVLPEKYKHFLVNGEETENSYLSIEDGKMVYVAIGALKEQTARIDELETKIEKLQKQLDEILFKLNK